MSHLVSLGFKINKEQKLSRSQTELRSIQSVSARGACRVDLWHFSERKVKERVSELDTVQCFCPKCYLNCSVIVSYDCACILSVTRENARFTNQGLCWGQFL